MNFDDQPEEEKEAEKLSEEEKVKIDRNEKAWRNFFRLTVRQRREEYEEKRRQSIVGRSKGESECEPSVK
jgi:hypothetical protein